MLRCTFSSLGQGAFNVLPAGLRTALRRRFSAPILTLLYHRVVPQVGADVNLLGVSCANFAAQLAWLADHARVVDESGFLELLGERPHVRRPHVLITFDDGYADNVRHALPILKRHLMSATLFVTSGAVGSNRLFWWDALQRAMHAAALCPVGVGGPGARCADDFTSEYLRMLATLKPYTGVRRTEFLERLAGDHGVSLVADDACRPVTWDELRAWRRAGMSVGAHSRTHPQLAGLDDDELRREIHESKAELERGLDAAVRTCAYPFGQREDFDPRAAQAVREAGYACAFANWAGNTRWATDRFALPRCLVRDWGRAEFAARFAEWCR